MKKFKFFAAMLAFACMHTSFASADVGNGNVPYFGGPVISNVKVHVLFWGEGYPAQQQKDLVTFYTALVDSTYIDQLAEFSTPSQKVGRGVMGEHLTITPFNQSKVLTQKDMEVELENQIAAGKIPAPDANSTYMFYFPQGYTIHISFGDSCQTWEADHEVYKSAKFGNVYYSMFPCANDAWSEVTMASSHELAETISDPACPLANQPSVFPAAWVTSDGQEIADICNPGANTLTSTKGDSYTVATVYLNSIKNCNNVAFTQAKSN